jgi:hypothetical protein
MARAASSAGWASDPRSREEREGREEGAEEGGFDADDGQKIESSGV